MAYMFKIIGFESMGPWFRTKIVDPLYEILQRGAEPKQLAFSAALGITLGLFPICGVTVFLCGLAIAVLGSLCHAPTVMLANFVATPVELSLIIPFLRFGEFLSGGSHFPLTSDALKKVLTGQASKEVLLSLFHALLGWLVAAPVILGMLYIMILPCSLILIRKFGIRPSSPKTPLLSHGELRLKTTLYESIRTGLYLKLSFGTIDQLVTVAFWLEARRLLPCAGFGRMTKVKLVPWQFHRAQSVMLLLSNVGWFSNIHGCGKVMYTYIHIYM